MTNRLGSTGWVSQHHSLRVLCSRAIEMPGTRVRAGHAKRLPRKRAGGHPCRRPSRPRTLPFPRPGRPIRNLSISITVRNVTFHGCHLCTVRDCSVTNGNEFYDKAQQIKRGQKESTRHFLVPDAGSGPNVRAILTAATARLQRGYSKAPAARRRPGLARDSGPALGAGNRHGPDIDCTRSAVSCTDGRAWMRRPGRWPRLSAPG
jgi:hypothetical protein